MKPPQDPSSRPTNFGQPQQPSDQPGIVDELEIEQALQDVERSLQDLKERYSQVQQDQQRQSEIKQRINQVQHDLRQTQLRSLKVELRQLQKQLETIEINLESRLFSWRSLKEPFWQAVRFGGLGVVIGWILKSWAR
jgi:ABC-type phosphate transport system auxiliary subunit